MRRCHGCLGPPRNRRPAHRPWNSCSKTYMQEVKHRDKGAKSHTVWYLQPSWDGSWPRSQVRREAVAGGGSERAGGAPRKSGKGNRGSYEKGGKDKMESSDAPQTSLSCMSCRTPGTAGFTLSLGMKRSPRDAGEPLPTEERESTAFSVAPYIDAAQVEPLLETQ